MKMNLKYSLLILILAIANKFYAQEVVGSGGGKIGNGEVKVTVTVGEPTAGEIKNGDQTVDVGFQQVYESEVISIEETVSKLTLNVYPNPTADKVTIHNEKATKLNYTITDVNGKAIKSSTSNETKIEIDLSGKATGTYFITFIDPTNKQQKTFKIIKK